MSFLRSDRPAKKHMARVCNLYRERVRSIKTVLFFIMNVSLLSGETVPTKGRPCQDEIMTTPATTVENQEKRIQNKLKVLQLTNKNTNKTAGTNLLKPIQRHQKLMESKVEECHEVKGIVQELKIGRGDEEDAIKDWSSGIEAELGKYEKVIEELEELEQKLREQEARETQEKEEKARLEMKKKFKAKTVEKESDAGKPRVKLPKLVITKFQETHLDWQRCCGQFEAEIDKSNIGQVPKVRAAIDGLPFNSKGYTRAKTILMTKYGKPSEVANAHIQCIMGLPVITGTNPTRINEFYDKTDYQYPNLRVHG